MLEGVKKLLNDPTASGLALELYNHALVNPLSAGKAAAGLKNIVTPAYIPSKDFACALVDVLQKVPGDFAALQSAVGNISDPQLKQILQGFLARAKGDLAAFQSQVADWFDNNFAFPTAAQAEAWPSIKAGRHTLIAAPTGSGKTLAAFLAAIMKLASERRRDGAFDWSIYEDAAKEGAFVETFCVDSWLEHMRQHQRVTNADRVLQDAVYRFDAEGDPAVRHLIAARPSEQA